MFSALTHQGGPKLREPSRAQSNPAGPKNVQMEPAGAWLCPRPNSFDQISKQICLCSKIVETNFGGFEAAAQKSVRWPWRHSVLKEKLLKQLCGGEKRSGGVPKCGGVLEPGQDGGGGQQGWRRLALDLPGWLRPRWTGEWAYSV